MKTTTKPRQIAIKDIYCTLLNDYNLPECSIEGLFKDIAQVALFTFDTLRKQGKKAIRFTSPLSVGSELFFKVEAIAGFDSEGAERIAFECFEQLTVDQFLDLYNACETNVTFNKIDE